MLSKVLFLLTWIVCGIVAQQCPPSENLAPSCMCRQYDGFAMMGCSNIMSAQELIPPIKATEGFKLLALNIADSSLTYIPAGIFKNTRFAKIRFENSQVMSLSEDDLAFEGLENDLEEIRATGSHYVSNWDWSQLKNHKKLDVIDVNNVGMHSLDNEFPHLKTLTALGISKAEISFLHPQAFRGLINLNLLILKHNEISVLSRSMLPMPSDKLHHIDLSHNHLTLLPNDLFNKMPSLQEVLLTNNKIMTLSEEAYSRIFNTLQMLMLKDNPIRCDCRLRWLVNHRSPLYFEGTCAEPDTLKGNTLRYLKHVDLRC